MTRPSEVLSLQSVIMHKVAAAAGANDLAGVKRWSSAAEDCLALGRQATEVEEGVSRLRELLNGVSASNTDVSRPAQSNAASSTTRSARADGAETRSLWVRQLANSGIRLHGSGKRYQTGNGRMVGLAFANELPEYPNKWWLGLPDQPTDLAVLLCREKNRKLLDVVVPVANLGLRWNALSRSNGQIKFNVRRDGSDLVLLIPGSMPVSVKQYVGAYDFLRK